VDLFFGPGQGDVEVGEDGALPGGERDRDGAGGGVGECRSWNAARWPLVGIAARVRGQSGEGNAVAEGGAQVGFDESR